MALDTWARDDLDRHPKVPRKSQSGLVARPFRRGTRALSQKYGTRRLISFCFD